MIHLIRNNCHDEADMWCGEFCVGEQAHRPDGATCERCLAAAAEFGNACTRRRVAIRMCATHGLCPILHHAADCDCGGRAGDR